jgi:hypothetical protein
MIFFGIDEFQDGPLDKLLDWKKEQNNPTVSYVF